MPLFDTEYQVEINHDKMSWEARASYGDIVMMSPHLCGEHEHGDKDHRGMIDMTVMEMTPFGIYLPPQYSPISLEQASILIEGLTEVGGWAHKNQQLGEVT